MAQLGFVSTQKQEQGVINISFDEHISGMLFDYSKFDRPFDDYPLLQRYFLNGQVQVINNLAEASVLGLNESGFMNGVPLYHIQQFYQYVGKDAQLYIMFASCADDDGTINFDAIVDMQLAAGGKIFQLGVWTERPVWMMDEGKITFTNLIGHIQSKAEVLTGAINKHDYSSSPLSIILTACTTMLAEGSDHPYEIDYRKLPEGVSMECPKVSLVLGQNGTSEVHTMQSKNHSYTPVGLLGLTMACLTISCAEECIGHVEKYDLNKNDAYNAMELGFGTIKPDDFASSYMNPIDDIVLIRRNILAECGYIFPTTYEAKEAGVFFSNDQTLSDSDYGYIRLNRVMHKCKRIVKSVMLPRVKSVIYIDPNSGKLSNSDVSEITSSIISALDFYLVNDEGKNQVDGRNVYISEEQHILEDDNLEISVTIVPAGAAESITENETYSLEN